MAAPIAFIQPPVPLQILAFPPTAYSICYDIYTRRNEDDAPHGWNSPRSNIYRRLKRRLLQAGFVRNQYSDWVHLFAPPAHIFNTMTDLGNILPPNKLSSTVKGLRMSRIDQLAIMDITENIALGGNFSTMLRGPVPTNLVLPVAAILDPIPGPIPPGAPFARPVDSGPGGADDPGNFLV
ncbi:hypothetical protein BGW80DRAFT_1253946 [Lactifluus volemus]|nr:hypothetical protein BGW80DRAFT_1253946 [Lactifluus volemus]